jgi:hypothetical protein
MVLERAHQASSMNPAAGTPTRSNANSDIWRATKFVLHTREVSTRGRTI